MKQKLRAIAHFLAFTASIFLLPQTVHSKQPNFILIFMDDMGYGDIGTFGGDPELTPELDRMAENGMALRHFYVPQPVCSPSRAGILTGVNPSRMSIFHVFFPNANRGMNPNEKTIASRLKANGYRTAMYGKWHLGDHPTFNPVNFGFEEFHGIPYSNDMWPHGDAAKGFFPPLPLLEGHEIVDPDIEPTDQKRLTKRFTERTIDFIKKNDERPFFIYLAHPMPHRPLFVSDAFEGKSGKGLYADVLMEIDWSVGEILKALRNTNQLENTLVVFTSDNGPWLRFGNRGGSSGGLRQGKLTCFEGGVRVPTIAHWPSVIPTHTHSTQPLMSLDLAPTMLSYAGIKYDPCEFDGKDIASVLELKPDADPIHEIIPLYYQENELQAVRSGKWKLVFPHHAVEPVAGLEGKDGPAGPQFLRNQELALFDMSVDPSESNNLASTHPEIVIKLNNMAQRFRYDLGDTLEGYIGPGRRPVGRVSQSASSTR